MYALEVLNPTGASEADGKLASPAGRPESLDGLTVGLLWNGKRGGQETLAKAGELLQHRYTGVSLRTYQGSRPCARELLERAARECDVFIGSTAD